MTMYWTSAKQGTEGNPCGNIPGLKAVIEGLGKCIFPYGKIVTTSDSITLTEGTIAVVTSGSSALTITVPQATNAPGKILFVYNGASQTATVQDDASTPNTIASVSASRAAILICDGSSWLHIPIVTTT